MLRKNPVQVKILYVNILVLSHIYRVYLNMVDKILVYNNSTIAFGVVVLISKKFKLYLVKLFYTEEWRKPRNSVYVGYESNHIKQG